MEEHTLVGGRRRPLLQVNPSRRSVLKAGATTLVASTVFAPAVLRADNLVIKVGHIAPKTGPMAGFAEAQDWTLNGIRQILAPGLQIGGKTYKVEIVTKDSQTDESRTAEVASELILKDKVDIITASSGSIDCNPTANVAELNEVPCITTDDPWESYYYGRNPPKEGFTWTYHFFWGLDQVLACFIGLWKEQQTNKVVGTLFNTAQDDTSWHDAFIPAIKNAGFTVVDPGQFPAFGNDFSPQVTAFKKAGVEIVTGNLFTPDFAGFYNQCAQMGYQPKVITLGKAFLFPADVASLGPRGVGVTSEVWWTPDHPYKSSLTGISCKDLAQSYEKDFRQALDAADPLQACAVRGGHRRAQALEGSEGSEVHPRRHYGHRHSHHRRSGEVDRPAGEECLHHAGGGRAMAEARRPARHRHRQFRRLP